MGFELALYLLVLRSGEGRPRYDLSTALRRGFWLEGCLSRHLLKVGYLLQGLASEAAVLSAERGALAIAVLLDQFQLPRELAVIWPFLVEVLHAHVELLIRHDLR